MSRGSGDSNQSATEDSEASRTDNNKSAKRVGCSNCTDAKPLEFLITMAFQPIVDLRDDSVYAYEALVRGKDGAGAGEVLSWVTEDNRYQFDQTCRTKAIEIASKLNIETKLSINFLPNAVYKAETCIRATIAAAEKYSFPIQNIIFEVTESEPVRDPSHLLGIFDEYQNRGFITAIDDFGAGYAGLNMLSKFRPDIIKLDMELCQGIAQDPIKQTITTGIITTARALGIEMVAEGIETKEDLDVLADLGIYLVQGYLFSKPVVEQLPIPDFSNL